MGSGPCERSYESCVSDLIRHRSRVCASRSTRPRNSRSLVASVFSHFTRAARLSPTCKETKETRTVVVRVGKINRPRTLNRRARVARVILEAPGLIESAIDEREPPLSMESSGNGWLYRAAPTTVSPSQFPIPADERKRPFRRAVSWGDFRQIFQVGPEPPRTRARQVVNFARVAEESH